MIRISKISCFHEGKELYITSTTNTQDLGDMSCVSERIHKSTTTINLQKEELTRDNFHQHEKCCPRLMLVVNFKVKLMLFGVGATQGDFSPSF